LRQKQPRKTYASCFFPQLPTAIRAVHDQTQ
jgi:hypothetical protein